MDRKSVLVVILIFVLIGMLGMSTKVQNVKASVTIYIDADGSIHPSTAPISTVDKITYVFTSNISWTHGYEGIEVDRSNIIINGNGHTLEGLRDEKGFYLSDKSNVTIINTNVKGFKHGIRLSFSSNCRISENSFTENTYAIHLQGSSNSDIIENKIIANSDGIYVTDFGDFKSSNNIISDNNIEENGGGIHLRSSKNTLRNNIMINNQRSYYAYGAAADNDVDVSNTVDGKPVYYWIKESDKTVPLDAGYIALINCTGITVRNQRLSRNGQGILLAYTTNSKITQNNVQNSGAGISLFQSSNNDILENNIIENVIDIELDSSSDNLVSKNNIDAKEIMNSFAIALTHSSNNRIFGNMISNHWHGIKLFRNSDYNNVSRNSVTATSSYSISIQWSHHNRISENHLTASAAEEPFHAYGIAVMRSSYNTVSGNNITHSNIGLGLTGSSNNSIFHNNFMNNDEQVESIDSTNSWDDGLPSGGNYWSNYVGVDENNDGIGDISFTIDPHNKDRYPLMNPHPIPEFPSLDWTTDRDSVFVLSTFEWIVVFIVAGVILAGITGFILHRKRQTTE